VGESREESAMNVHVAFGATADRRSASPEAAEEKFVCPFARQCDDDLFASATMSSFWNRYRKHLLRDEARESALDIRRMCCDDGFLSSIEPFVSNHFSCDQSPAANDYCVRKQSGKAVAADTFVLI
jgi:DNA-directed RNA polymerase subunit N (RpoN/RPB10)